MNNTDNSEVLLLIGRKVDFFKDVIQKTIIHVQKNKMCDILGASDVNTCIETLSELNKKINDMNYATNNTDNLINNLQLINNDLSSLLKNFGTYSLDDLLLVCFGNNSKFITSESDHNKLDLLKKYFHPTSYKVVNKKEEPTNSTNKVEEIQNLKCSDISSQYKQFYMKTYGIQLFIHSVSLNKTLNIYGVVDNVVVEFLDSSYITGIKNKLNENLPHDFQLTNSSFNNFISSLSLKDFLIYEVEEEIYAKYAGCITQNNYITQKQVQQIVKDFISEDTYNKRNVLINLLIFSSNYENQYLTYLLYDLLSNDNNGNVDTQEQTNLFDSLPWQMKRMFKQAMKKTIQYTSELTNFDTNKIPIEQQICLMKAPDTVKEKAMTKLKELKAKAEDSGSKARQYLDGLLKIPFGIYKREQILNTMQTTRNIFHEIYKKYNISKRFPEIPCKVKYTSNEILKYMKQIQNGIDKSDNEEITELCKYLVTGDKKKLINNLTLVNKILKKHGKSTTKCVGLTKQGTINELNLCIELFKKPENTLILKEILKSNNFIIYPSAEKNMSINNINNIDINNQVTLINNNITNIITYMKEVKKTLDKAVYGHEKAKKQIERIIGQWINGEQDGHCFGFEGPPGVGKTSLAKNGLSDCLKDEKGNSRPFAMIQMGGDSNGSSLHGHNYTYVGSTWGSIVQILMDKKCMNPIIFIDEVDKISRTEHGKEIVGILTHLLDTTQNDCFQDKYFTGIDLDLSKALFILSYNDVDAIDKILLDRVHRIKFNSLTIEDKLVISKNHILPEVYKKMGIEDIVDFPDEVLKFIIEEYTLESGVRKLKEILFEIVGEINLDILIHNDNNYEFPIKITILDVKHKYFKDKREVKIHKIHDESKVGIINALWANQMSQGGVLPLQASFIPSNKFLDLTLTGSMGEVMKESISVSLTNAWNLTSVERQKYLIERYNNTKNNNVYGIHIHCPDISTKKDGPSATTAFTVLLYSLFNNIKIKNYFGITGETHFGYFLTEIGGLQEKIIHSIKAGITEFIFPKENQSDFDKIMEKYKDSDIIKGIKFHSVNHIDEVLHLILEKSE